jgi:hypothetical protein
MDSPDPGALKPVQTRRGLLAVDALVFNVRLWRCQAEPVRKIPIGVADDHEPYE